MRTALALLVGLVMPALAAAIQYSPPQRVGTQVVRVAFVATDLEWVPEQRFYVVDGRRFALPPAALGYDRNFSFPRWLARRERVAGLRYWQFDRQASRRRVVELTFPDYRLVRRGPWVSAPGGDTVPDPPD
jgi:hypothetical protein